jgi:hypothetical protein
LAGTTAPINGNLFSGFTGPNITGGGGIGTGAVVTVVNAGTYLVCFGGVEDPSALGLGHTVTLTINNIPTGIIASMDGSGDMVTTHAILFLNASDQLRIITPTSMFVDANNDIFNAPSIISLIRLHS